MNILITGGASGLGAAITEKLASGEGNHIYFTFCSSSSCAAEIEKKYNNTKAVKCDFRNENDVEKLQNIFAERNVSILVNNAFTGFERNHFHRCDPKYFLNNFSDNIMPVIKITKSAITHFRKQKSGKIITILSSAIVGKHPAGWSEYVAQKSYLHSLCKSWALENVSFNISSNCISPSFMKTKLNSDIDERIVDEMEKSHPLKKLLEPSEVAEAVNYFVHASQYINGTNLIINAAESVI